MNTVQEQFDKAHVFGDLKTVKTLINHPDVDPSHFSNFPIRVASRRGYKDIVELLMQDPRVDPSDVNNWAISWAAEDGHKEIVELLMEDPRVDPSDYDNYAIRYAAIYGHKDIVELLLTDKRVMDKIDVALNWCKVKGGYEFLKGCMERQEKEWRIQEAIEEMSADCELYF